MGLWVHKDWKVADKLSELKIKLLRQCYWMSLNTDTIQYDYCSPQFTRKWRSRSYLWQPTKSSGSYDV